MYLQLFRISRALCRLMLLLVLGLSCVATTVVAEIGLNAKTGEVVVIPPSSETVFQQGSDSREADENALYDSETGAVVDADSALISAVETAPESVSEMEATEVPEQEETVSWRERYTLGPSDVVNIRFYGQPDLARSGVRIAPDGTISYLHVNSLQVADSTIDELRLKLEEALSTSYRNPRLIITPWELKSKRYIILGKVIDKGVFTLERPITLLEAIARSRGIETGLFESNTVELADMDRSFVIRNGRPLNVDFAKLYFEGDLSQNVYLEPQDYIYLASNLSSEYFVFGAVRRPGSQGLTYKATVVTAITRREGFADDAWRRRVLLVRGSLTNPETHVINVREVIAGREPDFPIEAGDIIYVHPRPWYKVEQILDDAMVSYLESATSTWTNVNVPDIIQRPFLPYTGWRDEETE